MLALLAEIKGRRRFQAFGRLYGRKEKGELPPSGQANTVGASYMLFAVVEGLAVLGERDEAAKLYPLVLEAMDTGAVVRLFADGSLQTAAGIAAAAGGQWKAAEEHYRTALRHAHELPHKIEQPEVRRWCARMLIDHAQTGAPGQAGRPGDAPGTASGPANCSRKRSPCTAVSACPSTRRWRKPCCGKCRRSRKPT